MNYNFRVNEGMVFAFSPLMRILSIFFNTVVLLSCTRPQNNNVNATQVVNTDTSATLTDSASTAIKDHTIWATTNDTVLIKETSPADTLNPLSINTGNITPQQLVAYAKTLIGTPYKYGSIDPQQGFDCSGFITYVFNHFNIKVPRSSVQFTNLQNEISLSEAEAGNIILFTGTDETVRTVGHMGIITSTINNEIQFIHSTSGKTYGVTISSLNDYYKGRFIKVIRVFRQKNDE